MRPYARYGESVESVMAAIETAGHLVERGGNRQDLAAALPPGAARNALDCALWDLEAKIAGVPAHVLAGIDRISPATTASPSAWVAREHGGGRRTAADRPILKVKLGGGADDPSRIAAVRRAAPDAMLLVDANEGWRAEDIAHQFAACAAADVAVIEQPLPAADDAVLADMPHPIPICADESVHGLHGLARWLGATTPSTSS